MSALNLQIGSIVEYYMQQSGGELLEGHVLDLKPSLGVCMVLPKQACSLDVVPYELIHSTRKATLKDVH